MKKYGKVPEVAEILKTSEGAVSMAIKRRQIPYVKWGKKILIPLDSLQTMLDGLLVETRPD